VSLLLGLFPLYPKLPFSGKRWFSFFCLVLLVGFQFVVLCLLCSTCVRIVGFCCCDLEFTTISTMKQFSHQQLLQGITLTKFCHCCYAGFIVAAPSSGAFAAASTTVIRKFAFDTKIYNGCYAAGSGWFIQSSKSRWSGMYKKVY